MTISICHFLPSTISICHLHRCFAGRTILCNKPASNPREGVFYYSRTKTRTLKLVCPTTRFTFGYRRNEHVAAQGVTVCTRRSRRGVAHSVRNIGSARNRPERPIQARPSPGGAPAHRHQTPQSRLWEAFGGVSHVAVSGKQSGPTGRCTPIHNAYACARAMGAAGQHAERCQT